jgi:hypothetical protein
VEEAKTLQRRQNRMKSALSIEAVFLTPGATGAPDPSTTNALEVVEPS